MRDDFVAASAGPQVLCELAGLEVRGTGMGVRCFLPLFQMSQGLTCGMAD